MSRRPSPRYWDSRKGYYTQFNGKQHRLADGPDDAPSGPTFLKALEAYKQLMELGAVSSSKDENTIRAVLDTYLVHNKSRLAEATFSNRLYGIRPFAEALGDVSIRSLTHFMVEGFIAEMRNPRGEKWNDRGWGDSGVTNFLESANAGFNWAVRVGLTTINPLKGIKAPPARSRSRECVITPEQHALILASVRSEVYRRVVVAFENTGCRPGELVAATAAAWHNEDGALVYYADTTRKADEFRHKAASKKDRVIFFTGEALAMMRQLVKDRPTGPLFVHTSGRPIGVQTIVRLFRRIRKQVGLPKLTAYSYRHTRATRWLLAGRGVDVLAELLGNTPNVIRKHYSHLMADRGAIRRQLEDFLGVR